MLGLCILIVLLQLLSHTRADVDIYHQCERKRRCYFNYVESGLYSSSKILTDLQRIDVERLPKSSIDVSQLPSLTDIFINHQAVLPVCNIVIGFAQNQCISVHDNNEPPVLCCKNEIGTTPIGAAANSEKTGANSEKTTEKAETVVRVDKTTVTAMITKASTENRTQGSIPTFIIIILIVILMLITIFIITFIIKCRRRRHNDINNNDLPMYHISFDAESEADDTVLYFVEHGKRD